MRSYIHICVHAWLKAASVKRHTLTNKEGRSNHYNICSLGVGDSKTRAGSYIRKNLAERGNNTNREILCRNAAPWWIPSMDKAWRR